MYNRTHIRSFIIGTLSCFTLSTAIAHPSHTLPNGKQAGPSGVAKGKLMEKMADLPPQAQERIRHLLEKFAIPEEDIDHLAADPAGELFYVEPAKAASSEEDDPVIDFAVSASDAFNLHSLPGARNVIYLDFDGHILTGTAWNSGRDYHALPYDRDGNPYSFSASELTNIAEIWHRVAEDYKPFNVNVTTEEPPQFNSHVARVLITHNVDANGQPMPYGNYGGVAYIGVWGRSDYTYYQPALVYYNNLGNGAPRYVAESASHEMGHNGGLSHDGGSGSSYYAGHGSGYINWAPIMGNAHGAQVSQWSNGNYSGATNTQDDISILAGRFGFRADDHGNGLSSATQLLPDDNGVIRATNPETDPYNNDRRFKGTLHNAQDVDYFQFSAGTGQLSIQVTPAWHAFTNNSARGANLDIEIRLIDSAGRTLQTANPTDDTMAAISRSITEGDYYLSIRGVGSVNYSDYASNGQYFIDADIPAPTDTNRAPSATDDTMTLLENSSGVLALLANDTDPDGDSLRVFELQNPAYGSVVLEADQRITYTPNPDFVGSDQLTYTVTDDKGGYDSAIVTITVEADSSSSGSDDSSSGGSDDSSSGGTDDSSSGDGNDTPDPITIPSVPDNFSATVNRSRTATVKWDDVAGESLYEVQQQYYAKRQGGWGSTQTHELAADQTSMTRSVKRGRHRFRIRAGNTAGQSAWSDWRYINAK